jgi:hypothetical protein
VRGGARSCVRMPIGRRWPKPRTWTCEQSWSSSNGKVKACSLATWSGSRPQSSA